MKANSDALVTFTYHGEGERLDWYLRHEGLSSSIVKTAKWGGITVNGEVKTVRYVLQEGDAVSVRLPDEVSENITPIPMPLDILYEDAQIIAINKPTGMPTHPSRGNHLPTLAEGVMAYFGGEFVFRAVSRLDKDTSGIVLIAKDRLTAYRLSEAMKRGEIEKEYVGLVKGLPEPPAGSIDLPMEREAPDSQKRCVRENGKPALTRYEVLETRGENALVKLIPVTGRTHQLRVHMSAVGHPLVGDALYGESDGFNTYFLHACRLRFRHPTTKKWVEIRSKANFI